MRRTSAKVRQAVAKQPTAVVSVGETEQSELGERTARFLRRRHPARVADSVAADLKAWRVKPATIAKMLERESAPGPKLLLAMACVYGPEYLRAVLTSSPAWLDLAYRAQRQAECEREMAVLQAELDALR